LFDENFLALAIDGALLIISPIEEISHAIIAHQSIIDDAHHNGIALRQIAHDVARRTVEQRAVIVGALANVIGHAGGVVGGGYADVAEASSGCQDELSGAFVSEVGVVSAHSARAHHRTADAETIGRIACLNFEPIISECFMDLISFLPARRGD
jgi:hypothetical protein